ncbi:Phosphatase 2C family protein isoform 4 [Theobroma cacao]|uniref:Phosphatase 2C family protein isoform 4 n=1 Tax=Theobroma cacao TaxID=3641 RepID=A0A061DQK2_THECC|nr:Phosphatase 2C family protein isoform 4 [Theobroma cacao]EOX94653.1 Phosphatase 2C family protein isoform 4 [Theobroma cacao]
MLTWQTNLPLEPGSSLLSPFTNSLHCSPWWLHTINENQELVNDAATMSFKLVLVVLGFLVCFTTPSYAESSTCLMVYKEGGAPAVFQSPKCPLWKLPNHDSGKSAATSTTARCQSALLRGRRKHMEDRTLCMLDLHIPFPSKMGVKQVTVGIVAVFDGHNGAEASEMASKLLLDYFALHTYFLLDATFSVILKRPSGRLPNMGERDIVFQVLNWDEELGGHELNFERFKFSVPENLDDSFHLDILKEALLRAVHDIDVVFSKEASRKNLGSGSTATVILLADGQILVANIGDSKAILCSEKFLSPVEAKASLLQLYREQRRNGVVSPLRNFNFKLTASNGLLRYIVKELTRDHHPDRDDERSRVEAAGGYVVDWGGVPRVNGQLAISRAIGDVLFKSYGVTAAPEVTDWQSLTANDSYLVVGSDGVFEKLSLQDVCDLLWEVKAHGTMGSGLSSSCSLSLADCLVNTAFEKGSMDNMAATVVPLGSAYHSQSLLNERCGRKGQKEFPSNGLQEFIYERSGNGIIADLLQLEHTHPIRTKFSRLLVEGKRGSYGCFYLFEKLDNDVDDTIQTRKEDQEDYVIGVRHALPNAFEQPCGGPLNVYSDRSLCLNFGMTVDGANDQCVNPESFASFLGLLESIPFHDTSSSYGSEEYPMPDSRYVLKKRFGRGSYGEVWLSFSWNCHQGSNASSWSEENQNTIFGGSSSCSNTSSHDSNAGFPDGNLFILKRIMVERGASVYLSGLREKYFGEVFLNASRNLGSFPSAEVLEPFLEESQSVFNDPLDMNPELGITWSSEKIGWHKAAYEEGLNHIARYVESFESRSNEIWLVFHYEGMSLSKLMYTVEEAEKNATEEKVEEVKQVQVLRPSKWWHWLKTTEEGHEEMRNLIRQLLVALKSCHDRNITHRDIKPENMVICFEDQETGRCLRGIPSGDKNFTTRMRIIDFGSAIDGFTMKHLYGSTGPSRSEQTHDYSPPEALLNASWYQGATSTTLKYDMWSVGVVVLEMILGSPNVFQISAVTRTLLDHHLEGWNEGLKELAYKLRSFMELCILITGSSSKHHRAMNRGGISPASWKCSEEFFSHQIRSRDPLKLGFPNVWALRLVRDLLLWDPDDRLSVDDALRHPYFQPRKS